MTASLSTRERLIDEAMRLFGEQGYRATSVAQIEEAAGLTPGSGGLYHHFRSKELLLEAGIERHANRLRALRDIRVIFEGLTDLRSELTVLGRYTLEVIDEESQLLRIMASELRDKPKMLAETLSSLIRESYSGMTNWVRQHAPVATDDQAAAIATIALGTLFAQRNMTHLLGTQPLVDDETLVAEWVEMIGARIEALQP
ncbi:MAG TPA: helix-turn-helix domain-containing protein [Gordonia sp. (in: high G+C Gram-positive bacteria)]|uniref:TetR/AcrR family transcriptional regulator n=2 Tax=Gordonia TaxID=2053 RepID=UPI0025C18A00|nr:MULTISPECIES: TetR/AcrR family transcriptional regulator [unclassified Gordonia (in: high G+C Gram-positive bacteria)]HNP57569.1 helix-turn-helix domain-containing protein [Gordonia sp. (in: high G+C Gram-positive bacteria)]HRC49596.1 helix-turn-helix domain-containing protein [Gordonia sp. (in: high G+C Gram-positive bacteria)]